MASKKKISNKTEKAVIENKSIDWKSLPNNVIIIGKKSKHLVEGKEYPVTKETAKLLIEKKIATLK